eukprot:1308000-Pyramimonas_sp.AAC.1
MRVQRGDLFAVTRAAMYRNVIFSSAHTPLMEYLYRFDEDDDCTICWKSSKFWLSISLQQVWHNHRTIANIPEAPILVTKHIQRKTEKLLLPLEHDDA